MKLKWIIAIVSLVLVVAVGASAQQAVEGVTSTGQFVVNRSDSQGSLISSPDCSTTAFISALGAATSQVVALTAGQKIHVCTVNLGNTNATATNIKLVEGTGTNCATGQAQLTGNVPVPASGNVFLPFGPSGAVVTLTAGDALCATGSAAGAVDVTVTYGKF